jgi:hypothetical protein
MSSDRELAGAKAITFVVAVSSHGNWAPRATGAPPQPGGRASGSDILEKNFLLSPCLADPHPHQILLQQDFRCAGAAYNDAIDKSVNDLIVFCHQDMFFPEPWISQVQEIVTRLSVQDPNWGVLGCCGATSDGQIRGYVYSTGIGIIGVESEPAQVQTLDEIVVILRKSSGLRFDNKLPHFHLYGSDICLRAALHGMKSYAIAAFCVHNAYANFHLSREFYECCRYMRRTWRQSLPIQTTCVKITRSNVPIYIRRLKEMYFKHVRRRELAVMRAGDVVQVFEEATRQT